MPIGNKTPNPVSDRAELLSSLKLSQNGLRDGPEPGNNHVTATCRDEIAPLRLAGTESLNVRDHLVRFRSEG